MLENSGRVENSIKFEFEATHYSLLFLHSYMPTGARPAAADCV